MSYKLRLYETDTNEAPTGYTDIPSTAIYNLSIEDNRASNDDPFEIIGRTAKVGIIREEPYITLINGLLDWDIPVVTDSPNLTYNKDFYRNLFQIINESTNVVIFTGYLRKDFLGYDLVGDTIELTICDSLYLWITLAKVTALASDANEEGSVFGSAPGTIQYYVQIPFWRLLAQNSDYHPLNSFSYGSNTFPSGFSTINVDLPFGTFDYGQGGWALLALLGLDDNNANDWRLVSDNAAVWSFGDETNPNIMISYFSIYKNRFGSNTYKCLYRRSILVWEDGYYPSTGANGLINATSLTALENSMVTNYVMPSNYTRHTETGTAYAWNGSGGYTIPVANQSLLSYINSTEITESGSTITLNMPSYGYTQMSFRLRPTNFRLNNASNLGLAQIMKGLCTLYSLGMRSKPTGGIDVFNSLVGSDDQASELTIPNTDLLSFKAQGTYADVDSYKNALDIFASGEFLKQVQSEQIASFLSSARNTYTITLPSTYYTSYTWQPFKPITANGVKMYVYKWSEPLIDDTFTIEAFGGLT